MTQAIRAPYVYELTLTPQEYNALEWLEGHGYSGDLIRQASATDDQRPDGQVVLYYRESDAWAVHEAYDEDPHAFGTCAAPELARKMLAFIEGIV